MVSLPLEGENVITCVTCHNPHERGLLKGPAGVGADEENRLRMATFNEICSPCHGRR
jgi:formate-dependent nitrite reductase cytochrome c552 subunit